MLRGKKIALRAEYKGKILVVENPKFSLREMERSYVCRQ